MSFFESLSVAFSLSVDACVVALLYGQLKLGGAQRFKVGLMLASAFGFSQFVMPLIGFWGGKALLSYIEKYDHWVAFGLLALVSLNMVKEGLSKEQHPELNLHVAVIVLLSLATSLDALAVGFSLGLIYGGIFALALLIGICCFSLVLCCFYLGVKLQEIRTLNQSMNLVGALILMFIGILILREHGAIVF